MCYHDKPLQIMSQRHLLTFTPGRPDGRHWFASKSKSWQRAWSWKAVARSLDGLEEFGKFLRRSGGFIKAKGPDNLNKRTIELGGAQTAGLGRALESTPTAEMRANLEV